MVNNEAFLHAVKHFKALADIFEKMVAGKTDEPVKEKPVEKRVSLEDVRAVLGQKSQAGLTAEVKELITKFGGSKLSDVPPEQYAALLKEAEALGHG